MNHDEFISSIEDTSGLLYLDRRDFLKLLSGGIIILFCGLDGKEARGMQRLPKDFNAFLRIGEDGRVTIFTGKIEMGQGVITSLPQMAAEELGVPLSSVSIIMGDTDLCPWDMGTFGSMTTRFFGPPLREAAAEARAVLIDLAAEKLGVPKDSLITRDGFVSDMNAPFRKVSFGDLARGKRIERRLENKPSVKPFSQFTVSGFPLKRADARDKVTGKAKYSGDIRLPGMLYARILRPPAHGAKLRSADTTEAEKIEGVRIIRNGEMIAVLHPQPDIAARALGRIRAEFTPSELKQDDQTIHSHLLTLPTKEQVLSHGGELEAGRKMAATLFDNTYITPYVAHSAMETHTALAHVEGNKATVWASTQTPFPAREEVARALGFASSDVRIIPPFLGGGFGGKTRNRQVVEAALLSKLAGKPVQVAFTREEEFFYDTFQPASIVKIKSGLDQSNRIVYWDSHIYYAGGRGAECLYAVAHNRISSHSNDSAHPFETGAWRAPGVNTNVFARESHIDVMAARAGMDPLEFRMANLTDKRMRRVLETVAKAFGWTPAKAPSGRGVGVSCGIDSGTFVALMAEVDVNRSSGEIRVKRVVCAQDMGQVINPEGAAIQMLGCIMMGMGYSLREEIHFKNGEIQDTGYGSYEIPRFSWMPKIETVFVENNELTPQGGGEPAIINMGAVIANAVFDATGARLFRMPMTPERVKEALAQSKEPGAD